MKITQVDLIKLKRFAAGSQTPVLCRIWTDEGIDGRVNKTASETYHTL